MVLMFLLANSNVVNNVLVVPAGVYLFESEVVRGGEHHHRVVHRVLFLLLRLESFHAD